MALHLTSGRPVSSYLILYQQFKTQLAWAPAAPVRHRTCIRHSSELVSISFYVIKAGAGGCPWPPRPGEPVPSVPPVGQADFWKGVQGDISSWSQAEGREGEAGSEATVGRGLRVPSKSSGPPSATGAFGQPPAPLKEITYREMLHRSCGVSRFMVKRRGHQNPAAEFPALPGGKSAFRPVKGKDGHHENT